MLRSLALPLLFLALACAKAEVDARLKPLTVATLDPGVGLGDLRLGETTLGAFVDRYGHERVDLIAGDGIAYELVFAGGEMAFLFVLDAMPQSVELGTLKQGQRELTKVLAAQPVLRDMRLASLTVALRRGETRSLYAGKLSSPPLGLSGRMSDAVVELGVPGEGSTPMLAGASPRQPASRLEYPDRGIVLEGSAVLEDKDCVITRMTIFEPQTP
jgi:hypothetical protein